MAGKKYHSTFFYSYKVATLHTKKHFELGLLGQEGSRWAFVLAKSERNRSPVAAPPMNDSSFFAGLKGISLLKVEVDLPNKVEVHYPGHNEAKLLS